MSPEVETWFNAYCERCEWESAPDMDREVAEAEAEEHRCPPRPLSEAESRAIRSDKRGAPRREDGPR